MSWKEERSTNRNYSSPKWSARARCEELHGSRVVGHVVYLFFFLRSFLVFCFKKLCRCIAYRFTKISSSNESAATEKECKQQIAAQKTINLKRSKRITHDMDNNNKNYQKQ